VKLNDKVVIVTGGSRGIGRGIGMRFLREGARVIFVYRSAPGFTDEIKQLGEQATALQADIADADAAAGIVAETVSRYGRLDILVNCAGINRVSPSELLPAADWDRIIQVNLNGLFYCCQAAGRQMIAQRTGGSIINVSSGYGQVAAPERAPYCSSKAAVIMLTKVLGIEWARHGVRVNALAPGYTSTEMVRRIIADGILDEAAIRRRTPLGRLCEIPDVENAAVFLATEQSAFITAETITIDGGWTAYGYL